METLQAESGHAKGINPSKELSDEETPVTTELIVSITGEMESPQSQSKSTKHHVSRHGVSFV